MMASFINELNQIPTWDCDKAFIWITFSDDLAMQSKNKFHDYFENALQNNLLTVEDMNQGQLNKNDILFINWQKLVSRAAKNRILRRPEDPEFQKEAGIYFEDFIDNTRGEGREIVLVIDEAHKNAGTTLAKDIIDYINPRITIHVSATPEYIPNSKEVKTQQAAYIFVERARVVAEGLIKEKIVVQSDEDLSRHQGEDLDEVLLNLGMDKREELKEQFRLLGKNSNPLMLIQLPNDDRKLIEMGEQTKEEVVMQFLSKKGVKLKEIALWFDKHKENLEDISENDSEINYMLFKQAAGTGWDCPRAHVLVMFREISSPTFYVQTVGRILRMPEPEESEDYKNFSDLRTGYLYTNYKREEVEIPDQSGSNKPLFQSARLREKFKDSVDDFAIQSAYIPRIDYGGIENSAKFQMSFCNSMNEYFSIEQQDIMGLAQKKLKKKRIELDPIITNSLVVNAEFEDIDQLSFDFKIRGEDVEYELSHNDVEKTFIYLCYQVLQEQTEEDAKITNIARSWGPLKSALRVWFKGIFGGNSYWFYRIFIYDILKGASSIFRPAITQALKDYRPVLKKLLESKKERIEKKEAPVFSIRPVYSYSEDYEEVDQEKCILDKCYLRKDYAGRDNEISFLNYIDSKEEIEWWFKNGDKGKDYFAVKYFNTTDQCERLFYPDWVIMFKDRRVGLFDTKAGRTLDTEGRASGLTYRLKELGNQYIGGIVKEEGGIYVYSDSEVYDDISPKNNKWESTEQLFSKTKDQT